MQFIRDDGLPGANGIKSYSPGDIVVNNTHYHESLIITPEQIIHNWPPQSFDALTLKHIEALTQLSVDIILLGVGEHLRFPSPSLLTPFYEQGIGFEVMDTSAACRTYNVLMSEARSVGAALIL